MTTQTFSPISCACDKCKSMCAHSVCVPTPDEARTLIRLGYADRLGAYKFNPFDDSASVVAPATVGYEGQLLSKTTLGPCTFYKEGLCELHPLGLKPFEGRIAHHDRPWLAVRAEVLKTWRGKSFQSVIHALNRGKRQP